MGRVDALKELLAKVEAGEFVAREYPLMKLPQMEMSTFYQIHGAYNGSLDAAKALHDAVLGGWSYLVGINWVELWLPFNDGGHPINVGDCTPSRAWLIAILKALITQEEGIE